MQFVTYRDNLTDSGTVPVLEAGMNWRCYFTLLRTSSSYPNTNMSMHVLSSASSAHMLCVKWYESARVSSCFTIFKHQQLPGS